jgi:hypothetical protein
MSCPSHRALFLFMSCPFPQSSIPVHTELYSCPCHVLPTELYSPCPCHLLPTELRFCPRHVLPTELYSCPCNVLLTELYICTCLMCFLLLSRLPFSLPFLSSYISGLYTVSLIILSKDIYFFPIPLCFHLSWALVSPQGPLRREKSPKFLTHFSCPCTFYGGHCPLLLAFTASPLS